MDTRALDESVQTLNERKDVWARLPVGRKIEYLGGILQRYSRVAARQVAESNRAKGVTEGTPRAGEEWAHPYQTVRLLRLLRESLRGMCATGSPPVPRSALRTRPDGQVVAKVFPVDYLDRLLYARYSGEVWMQRGVTEENLKVNMAGFYRRQNPEGKVALVLGAGNVASIGPSDVAQKLFVEGQVCLFKNNPVNEYLGPCIEEAFGEVIRDGFLRVVNGAADVGDYLCNHPGVDEIHITGSNRTYEAIVFGPGGKKNGPRTSKRVTCELGNVTPVIVVPGAWSDSDVEFHAVNIATQMTVNCGFNCLSAKVLVLPAEWPRARQLMSAIRAQLAAQPQRAAYYPGAEARYDEILAANAHAAAIGPRSQGVLPFTLVPGIDPEDRDNVCFKSECFMPLLAQTSLPGRDPAEFLSNAVEFANRTLWGTLSANLVIHPSVERALGTAFEDAVAALRYGTVGVNQWTALGYVWGSTTWGAFPGHSPEDIQSGSGVVHNSFMFDRPEKSVIRGPFRTWPKPAWFANNRRTDRIFRQMFELELRPSLLKAAQVALTAIPG